MLVSSTVSAGEWITGINNNNTECFAALIFNDGAFEVEFSHVSNDVWIPHISFKYDKWNIPENATGNIYIRVDDNQAYTEEIVRMKDIKDGTIKTDDVSILITDNILLQIMSGNTLSFKIGTLGWATISLAGSHKAIEKALECIKEVENEANPFKGENPFKSNNPFKGDGISI